MVHVTKYSIKNQIDNLSDRLQKEWYKTSEYYSSKTYIQVFNDFNERYNNFDGIDIKEFLCMPNVLYIEWEHWMYRNGYYRCDKTFIVLWNEFKIFFEFYNPESKVMFQEMELLGENMLSEWRFKYYQYYPHVYEKNVSCYLKKSKAQLWNEFKEIWEIDILNYNENKYTEMDEYISEIIDNEKFYEYCEDSNYHSFDSYSIIEQFEICKEF